MDENSRDWIVWATRSARNSPNESNAPQDQPERLDPCAANMRCCSTDTSPRDSPDSCNWQGFGSTEDYLGNSSIECHAGIEVQDGPAASIRKLDSLLPEQDEIDTQPEAAVPLETEMRSTDFLRLVNSSGLGEVLTERNLLRQRRAFGGVDAGRGRMNVVNYVAAICSRRRRKRLTNDLSVHDLEAMLTAQQFRCALTEESLTPENVALDHIVPISEGGSFTADNSQLVTRAANRAKHTMSQREFVSMCRRVSRTHDAE